MSAATIKNMGFLTTMKAGFSYLKSVMFKKPEDSLENFYINRFGKVLYSMFFEGYTEKLWGRHPSEISADWGSQRVKGLSIRAVLKDMFSKAFGGKNHQKRWKPHLLSSSGTQSTVRDSFGRLLLTERLKEAQNFLKITV